MAPDICEHFFDYIKKRINGLPDSKSGLEAFRIHSTGPLNGKVSPDRKACQGGWFHKKNFTVFNVI